MIPAPTYIARWYVNGRADVGLVSEASEDLAREVVKVRLEKMSISPDRDKIRLTRWEPHYTDFLMLSHGGHV
jgi:hypothetical protein